MTNRKVFVGGIIISLLAIVYLLSYPKAIPVAATQQRPVVVYEAMKRPAPVRRNFRPIRLPPSPKQQQPLAPVPPPAHVMLTQTSEARPFPDEATPSPEPQPMPAPSFVEPPPTPPTPLALSSLAQAYTPSVLPRRARALPMSRKSFRSQPQSFTPPLPPPPHETADRRPVTLIKDL